MDGICDQYDETGKAYIALLIKPQEKISLEGLAISGTVDSLKVGLKDSRMR
jgi:hypothetical protein